MKLSEYVNKKFLITLGLAAVLDDIFVPNVKPALTRAQTMSLGGAAVEIVKSSKTEAAELAREFYDSERVDHIGDTYPVDLQDQWSDDVWLRDIETVLRRFENENSGSPSNIGAVGLNEVESSARRTMVTATEADPEALGWARVQGKESSCAFCTMLISRGPVYGEDSVEFESHRFCDCGAVPVFDRKDWPGRDEYEEANRLYVAASKAAEGTDLDVIQTLRKQLEAKESK